MKGIEKKRRYVTTFMTAGEAAASVGMSENAIRWNCLKGYLKADFDGYRWKIKPRALKRWREEYYSDRCLVA